MAISTWQVPVRDAIVFLTLPLVIGAGSVPLSCRYFDPEREVGKNPIRRTAFLHGWSTGYETIDVNARLPIWPGPVVTCFHSLFHWRTGALHDDPATQSGENQDGVAPRLARPRRRRAFGCAGFGGIVCRARGGGAIRAWRKMAAAAGVACCGRWRLVAKHAFQPAVGGHHGRARHAPSGSGQLVRPGGADCDA